MLDSKKQNSHFCKLFRPGSDACAWPTCSPIFTPFGKPDGWLEREPCTGCSPAGTGIPCPSPGTGSNINHTASHTRLSEPVFKAVRESEKSKCKISMFCGAAGTDCPYVTHTHYQSAGKCTYLPGFHFFIFPGWTCQRNFVASPYTFARNAWFNLSQMDFPHAWALIKEKTSGGQGGRIITLKCVCGSICACRRASCVCVLRACTHAAVANAQS